MASRQKSFFDQDLSTKAKPQWQRNKEEARRRDAAREAQDPPPVKSAIPPSFSARQKLKGFARNPSPNRSGQTRHHKNSSTTTENADPGRPGPLMNSLAGPTTCSKHTGSPPKQDSAMPPSTPAMRLPLAELIGNTDDASMRHQIKEPSPEDHIGWIPNSSNSALTPGQRRKRARSSSPVSASSQNDKTPHFAYREPLDFLAAQHAAKTPQADPVAELWNRYATGLGKDKLPDFARLIDNSSPRPMPRTPDAAGLRRWASCGAEWPPSRVKKRRGHGVFRDQQHASLQHPQPDRNVSGPSRVGMLVNQIQASLALPSNGTFKTTGPSSSLPLPELKEDLRPEHDSSPPQRQQSVPPQSSNTRQLHVLGRNGHVAQRQAESSDYGGDDVDDATLMDEFDLGGDEFEQDMLRQTEPTTKTDRIHPNDSASQVHVPVITLPTIEEDFDDFGDDEDMFNAENLEQAVPLTTQINCATTLKAPVRQGKHDPPPPIDLCDDSDEFGGSDIDDETLAAVELSATQAYNTGGAMPDRTRSRAIQRYLVKETATQVYIDERQQSRDELVLHVEEETSRIARTVHLRDSWSQTHVTVGAYVHIVGQFSTRGQIIIDSDHNLIIVHPDHLISATAVADSFDCLRKAVLQDRVKATSGASNATVYGSMLHEIFQTALLHNKWDRKYLAELVDSTTTKYVESLYETGAKTTAEAVEHLSSKMPELSAWASTFVKAEPGPYALADDRNGKQIGLSVKKLLDVEEHVWSPMYGLKGNIDATVEVVMDDDQGRRTLTVPFEVKTGKYKSASHRAQTALYTLLLSDRYDLDIFYGLLFYMDGSTVTRIPAIRRELQHMVMQRNELANFVKERLELPPMLQNEFKCGRCYAKTSCFIYHKLGEEGTSETAGAGAAFLELVGNLQPVHQTFFKHWDDLMTKEESETLKLRRELWTMLSHERAKVGRAFSELIIEPGSKHAEQPGQKINRFTYVLVKKDPPAGFSFTESQIAVGEAIVISSEEGHFALANGYVAKVSRKRITVAVDRKLHNSRQRQPLFDSVNNQVFSSVMEVGKRTVPSQEPIADSVVYRLDKDEFSNGMAKVRNNLLALMDDNEYRAAELRQLIVENRPPVFSPNPTNYTLLGSSSQLARINEDQRAAIDKVMSAKDYALVLGMPGTGKTTTIVHIIRALVGRGKSVLLTSYTHTAVDNILLKLRGLGISILRLGVLSKIHPEVQEFAKLAAVPPASIDELENMYMSPQVVATTCLGIDHPLFKKRIFDYCIVDEASQITLPVCLGPIRMARTFVLVGDHYQLPPLVQNKDAQQGGLDVSLFKLLSDRQQDSVVCLEHQYRMCAEVMALSNALIYDGRLKCGNEQVARRRMELPEPHGLDVLHLPAVNTLSTPDAHLRCASLAQKKECWLADVLDPERPVVFANCDPVGSGAPHERVLGSRITNATEVTLVTQTVLGLLALGVPAAEIGVIAFYRSQLGLLRQALKGTEGETVEMHTVDKFQGRDKEVVILSCVRSNDGNVGDLLRDWRRVNVAFTRSRSKLVVFGSRGTLGADELLKKFLKLVDSRGWVVDLPRHALEAHDFRGFMNSGLASVGTCSQKKKTTSSSSSSSSRGRHGGDVKVGETPRRATGHGHGVLRQHDGLGNIGSPSPTALRKAAKTGKVTQAALVRAKPVLNDLVNEILGDSRENA